MAKWAALRATKDGFEATYERALQHPADKVWATVATAEGIASWFVRNELEGRAGGRYVLHHDHAGVSHEERVERWGGRVFVHTWGGADGPDAVTWEVHPTNGACRLVVTWRFRDAAGAQEGLAGWHVWLDVLEAVLAGQRRAAHEPPHGTLREGRLVEAAPGRGAWTGHAAVLAEYARRLAGLVIDGPGKP